MAVDKVLQTRWDIAHLQIAAPPHPKGNLFGDIHRPTLSRIESDDPDRIAVLAREQVFDHGFQFSGLIIGVDPGVAGIAEAIGDQIDRLICPVRYDRRRPVGLTLNATPPKLTEIQADKR